MLKGMAASGGIGIGKAVLMRPDNAVVVKCVVDDPARERRRMEDAIEQFCTETMQFCESVSRNIGEPESKILSVQIAIARDPELLEQITRKIEEESVNAEYAFSTVCDSFIDLFANTEQDLVRTRVADLRDIRDRMVRILTGTQSPSVSNVPPGSILVAEDISPSLAADIDSAKIHGIVTQIGTGYSHIAIIARALKMPAVVALENVLDIIKDGDDLIIDGAEGIVLRNPDEEQAKAYQARKNLINRELRKLESYRNRVTLTMDGKRISLESNLSIMPELTSIQECQADGIGLFRTEFLYMDCRSLPDEEQQYNAYRYVLEFMKGKPVVIRTLDAGGDKKISYMPMPKESNPFLGHRAVRFSLGRTGIFKAQLAALLRASVHGNLKMLIPMVTSLTELWQVKDLIQAVKVELRERGVPYRDDIPLGIMVETPAAALCVDQFARETDFFCIGTNDLTQYTLAVDRNNESVSGIFSALHPAMLRLIRMSANAANNAGKAISICGEAASDPLLIPFFIGAGITELSVNAGSMLAVRRQIGKTSYTFWKDRVDSLLNLATVNDVLSAIQNLL